MVGAVLALAWLGAGIAALVFGLADGRWIVVTVGAAATVYGLLWLRVAATGRLLRGSDIARKGRLD